MADDLQVRVTKEDRQALEDAAAANGESVSDYARRILGLETLTESKEFKPLDFSNRQDDPDAP